MEPASLFHQNYEEDFLYAFRFSEDVPACPWRLIFNTYVGHQRSLASFAASFDGETHVNCDVVEGSPDTILVRFKNHRLPPGVLHYRLLRRVENDLFDDGEQKLVLPQPMPVELWEGPTDSAQPVTTIVLEPMLRGDSAYRIYKKHHPESTLTEAEYGEVPVAAAAKADTAAGKANKAVEAVMQLPVVRTDMEQTLSAEAQAQARRNISAVGALPVALTLGVDNALTVASPLNTLTAHYRLYAARPGAYRWGVVISDALGTQIEEAEAEVISAEGVLHLAFRPAVLGQRYDLALTLTADAVTAASVAPWLRESQTGVDTSQGHFEVANTDINKIVGDRSFQLLLTTGADVQTRQSALHIEPLGVVITGGNLYINAWGVPLCPYAVRPSMTYHVVGTFDYSARRVKLYVDGVFAGENTRTDAEPVYGRHILVGNGSLGSSTRFLGDILLNRNFNYVLSPEEVDELCNHGNPAGYVLPAAEKRAGRCITEYLPRNIAARPQGKPIEIIGENSYSWTGVDSAYSSFVPISTPTVAGELYKVNVTVSNYEAGQPFVWLGKIVNMPAENGTYDLIVPCSVVRDDIIIYGGNNGTDRRLTLTVNRIELAASVARSWYDSSKQLPVNGELPPLWGPAGGYDLAANGSPRIVIKSAPENAEAVAEVLAQSESSLEARIARLERALVSLTSGRMYVPKLTVRELEVWGANNLILTGEGAPTKAPDRAGQIYIDTQNNAAYRSTGNAAVSDWKNA